MRRARQGRQRIVQLFFRKRWLFCAPMFFGLAIWLRSDILPRNRFLKRRFRLKAECNRAGGQNAKRLSGYPLPRSESEKIPWIPAHGNRVNRSRHCAHTPTFRVVSCLIV
jgi:hypothetical protein